MKILLLLLLLLLPSPARAGEDREIKLAVHNLTASPLEVYVLRTVFCEWHFGTHYYCGLYAYLRGYGRVIEPDVVIASHKYFLLDRFFYFPEVGKFSVCVRARRPWTKSNLIYHQNRVEVTYCRLVEIPYKDFNKEFFKRITVRDRRPTFKWYQGKGQRNENFDSFDTYAIKIDNAKLE